MDLYPYFDVTAVSEKTMASNLEKINKSDYIASRDPLVEPDAKKRESGQGKKEETGDEAGKHFESLKDAADQANRELEKKRSPYRFYIYREFDETFINLVRLDGEGNVVEVKKKNITHQEFADLIKHIQEGEGLFFDSIG
ncbi:MAG TPA: flagellar protein FlaG [Spirochaetota bacterium]|jgi:uncharacterized FlaG/YvyC family protein|nr:flagellar protein FlaG [Spirochaetota bacterium]HPV43691.1 flagellar protein FlaG [Spirochaetota bacterium]